jgi:hypothetical protein
MITKACSRVGIYAGGEGGATYGEDEGKVACNACSGEGRKDGSSSSYSRMLSEIQRP